MRRATIAVSLVAALVLLTVTVATAHFKKYATTATITLEGSPSGDSFKGKVNSNLSKCEKRQVLVYRQSALVGQTRSDSTGAWELSLGGKFASPGKYTAKVLRKKLQRSGHRHICKSTVSPEFKVGGGGP
ncbi:MAG: hypothetical protein AABM29_01545 [Actinomycetota bacterium]